MTQDKTNILTAIDVGTTKVCTIIGKVSGPKDIQILSFSIVPSDGLSKGNVTNIASTEKAIRESVEDARRKAGVSVTSAHVGLTGAHVTFENRRDDLPWAVERGVITADDLSQVPERVAAASNGVGREVIHALPMSYSVDGHEGIRNPLGMHSRHLEVETHIVSGETSYIDKLVRAVEGSGLDVASLVLEPLASSEAVLTQQEKEQGVALVDIGGGTTDVVVFKNGAMQFTSVIPVGGYQFTNDICTTYNTPYEAAESVKLRYGHTDPYSASSNYEITLPLVGRTSEVKVSHREICQLMRERAQELGRLIKLNLRESEFGDVTKLRLVLTGGTSNLPGLHLLMQQMLTNRVRIGVPHSHMSIPDELREPEYATSIGILLWAAGHRDSANARSAERNVAVVEQNGNSIVARFIKQIKMYLPTQIFSLKRGRV